MSAYNPERTSTFSASERIMCSFLIESLNATPLNSIIYITRAAMMLPKETARQHKIKLEEVVTLFSVAERLVYTSKQLQETGLNKVKIDFSSLNYKNHIEPWVKMDAYEYYVVDKSETDKIDPVLDNLSDSFEKIVYSTKKLTVTGYQHMCSDFLMYAIPKAQQWSYILTTMISPDTYTDMLKVYKGAKDD